MMFPSFALRQECNVTTKPYYGGSRLPPKSTFLSDPVPIDHHFDANSLNQRKETLHLWMYVSDNSSVSYIPKRTMILSDHVDLFLLIKRKRPDLKTYLEKMWKVQRSKTFMWQMVSDVIQEFDSIIFTHHVDPVFCSVCCTPNKPKPYLVEIVALYNWTRFACPGHPNLRSKNGKCQCKTPHVSDKQKKIYGRYIRTSKRWWDTRQYFCE